MKIKSDKRIIWILFGLVSILIRMILTGHPKWAEEIYSRGLFPIVRFIFDYTVGWIPLPLLYVLILLLPIWLIWKVSMKIKKANGWMRKIYEGLLSVFALLAGLVGLFLWLWGYNYARVPIETQIGIEPIPISITQLKEELDIFTAKITRERTSIPSVNNNELTASFLPSDLESQVQQAVISTMLELGYPVSNKLPVRKLFKGSLLRIGTAGFYLPFTGECNLDAGLHPLQIPYVMAHEMAHGLGIGDEGSCNFIAYLSCTSSEIPFIRYGGYLSFWRTLASNYRSQHREIYDEYRAALPSGIIADLNAINENSNKYPDLFPTLRNQTYDAYLKTQGIEEGLRNYGRVVVLERAWRLSRE